MSSTDRPTRPERCYDDEHYAVFPYEQTKAYMDALEAENRELRKRMGAKYWESIAADNAKLHAENRGLREDFQITDELLGMSVDAWQKLFDRYEALKDENRELRENAASASHKALDKANALLKEILDEQ